jgi:hypothetical protein
MILLSILISFPLFAAFSYIVAKAMFPTTERVMADQQRNRLVLMQRARRVRKSVRMAHARVEQEELVPQHLVHA